MPGAVGSAEVTPVRNRRRQILCEMTTRETPRILLAFVLLIAAYVVVSPVSGETHHLSTYLTDVALGIYLLSIALLIRSEFLTQSMSPTLFASAVVVTIVAFNFEYSLEPDVNTLGIILICLTACGPLILMWRPFIVAMIAPAVLTVFTVIRFTPFHIVDWLVTILMAVGLSAVMLAARRSSATRLAIATVTIEEMATRDPLTGVLNRHGLDAASGTLAAFARRHHEPVFAAFVDIVGLKGVNDAYGHATGDLVIQRTSRAVESVSRGSDIVVRMGGDEFLVLGMGPQPDPRSYASRITAALDLTDLETAWAGKVSVGTSSSIHGDIDDLIDAADKAMYDGRSHLHQGIAPSTPTVHMRDWQPLARPRVVRSGDADDLSAGQAPRVGEEERTDEGTVEATVSGP
ncbi:MAG: GGDEF domain-containing protein [Actinomycetes bacterium]